MIITYNRLKLAEKLLVELFLKFVPVYLSSFSYPLKPIFIIVQLVWPLLY